MRIFDVVRRVRVLMKEGAADMYNHFGTTFQGVYEPTGRRIIGTVTDCSGVSRYTPTSIIVIRDDALIGSTDQFIPRSNGWTFELVFDAPFTTDDILKDRLQVFALDRLGSRNKLKLDGAVQLSFVKEITSPTETELLIDFSDQGNSAQYRLSGWSGQEPEHIWTDGTTSTIAISFDKPGMPYKLEILAWPFVVPEKLPEQTLIVGIGDTQLTKLYVRGGLGLIECDIPSELTETGQNVLRFDVPDATRPRDVLPEGGDRVIALAFRRVTLMRYLRTKVDPFRKKLTEPAGSQADSVAS